MIYICHASTYGLVLNVAYKTKQGDRFIEVFLFPNPYVLYCILYMCIISNKILFKLKQNKLLLWLPLVVTQPEHLGHEYYIDIMCININILNPDKSV
jgi:hypothetical protein